MTRNEGTQRCQRLEQQMNKHLPRARFDIDENDDNVTGVTAISIVDKPAIQSEFVVFSLGNTNAGRQRYLRAKHRMAKMQAKTFK